MSKELRILILNYEYPPLGGGAGIVTKHLAEKFVEDGFHVHVVTAWFPGQPEYSSEGNLSIIRLKSRRKETFRSNPLEMYSWAKHALRYFKCFSEERPFDICLANFTMPGGIVAKYLERRWKIPYVILSHGHDIPWFAPKQMFLWHALTFPWIRSIMRRSSANVILTDQLKKSADAFIGKGYEHKNVVIPNGMLMDRYKSGFNNKDKVVQVLFVGRMVEQKNPITFIKACKAINDLNIPAHFTMIGDGPLKNQVEKMAIELEVDNIDIMGQISHYDVLKTYEQTDVLVLPSREEAMSMVILEALSRGIYVISTPVSGVGNLVEDNVNGHLIKYGQELSISQAFADFYYNKYTQNYQYPEDVIKKLFSRYSWDRVAEQYIDLFAKITQVNSEVNVD